MKSEASVNVQEIPELPIAEEAQERHGRGLSFWLVFLAICFSVFLSALDFTAVSSALPTIIHALDGEDFVWVGSAYALASTALLPAAGGCAEIFGRRICMLASLSFFALGSALCGSAQSMDWFIAARTIQGAGSGGIQATTSIIIADLLPLHERANYSSMIGMVWSVASAIGPVVGGSLAQSGQWRWVFYLNLPITGLAAVLVILFLKLKTPGGTLRDKLNRMDWIGTFLIIASSTSTVIGLTWGGVRFPWKSVHVLLPLVAGHVGIILFMAYEAKFPKEPLIPYTLFTNRTSFSGYIQTFVGPLIMYAALYFGPTYFQACRNATPTRSGVELFGIAITLGPFIIVSGLSVAITKRYRIQLWLAWAVTMIAMGALSTLHVETPLSQAIGFWVLLSLGAGIYYATTYFPVLAPLPIEQNAHALAFFYFCRSFAGVWGVAIGTAVLQTQLQKRLPADFIAQFPEGVAFAYSIIPVIPTLPNPFQTQVRDAFASSIIVIWQVMIGISGIGFIASLFMKGLPLHKKVDEKWGLEKEPGREEKSKEEEGS